MTNLMDFEAWFKKTGIAEDYKRMMERAYMAGWAQSMNYYADNEECPNHVTFHGGRTVQVVMNIDGKPRLVVSRVGGGQ